MKKFKKVLILALTTSVSISAALIGAGAANQLAHFTDKEEIVHQEAVEAMVSLGILSGKEGENGLFFDPEAIVTRAEMAKVVASALNGGKNLILPENGRPTFFDTEYHWADPYISYCAMQNIITGRGDNTFGPDDPLTAAACAKMFLCALGYRSDLEGFVGSQWEVNVSVKANQDAKLYEGLDVISASTPLTRDNMAQMLYNAIRAQEVKYNMIGVDIFQTVPNGTMLENRFHTTSILVSSNPSKQPTPSPVPSQVQPSPSPLPSQEQPVQSPTPSQGQSIRPPVPSQEQPTPSPAPSQEQPDQSILSQLEGLEFWYSTGGSWSSQLTFGKNGAFEGNSHGGVYDEEAGDTYTSYDSNFNGSFSEPAKIDDNTYTIRLTALQTEMTPGTEDIGESREGEYRIVYTDPYGLEMGDLFYLYRPGQSTTDLPEDFLSLLSLMNDEEGTVPTTLSSWALYNSESGIGFLSN